MKGKAEVKGKAKHDEEFDADAEIGDEGTRTVIVIPVLINSRPLRKGEELKVFKEKAKAKDREVQPIKITSLAKKAKTKE